MNDSTINVLIIEDNPGDIRLIQEMFNEVKEHQFNVTVAYRLQEGLGYLKENQIDLVLLDLSLPDSHGMDTLTKARLHAPHLPIIVFTAIDSEKAGLTAVQKGAQDYWIKGQFDSNLFARAVVYAIERKQVELKLDSLFERVKKSHDEYLSILNMLRIGIAAINKNQEITFLNDAASDFFKLEKANLLGKQWDGLLPLSQEDRDRISKMFDQPAEQRKRLKAQIEFSSSQHYWFEIEVQDDPRQTGGYILFFYDMTDVYDLRLMLDTQARFHKLIGKCKEMQRVFRQIQDTAKVDWTVLIEGETGSGKELVARAIHYSSKRKDKPFIAVNCAGLTESLLSSQLFGHKRGAFTGAVEDQKGLFEVANGGTLFLDEIGDISQNVQTSLLRVLEEKEITRIGEFRPRKIDVRILVATNKNLNKEVEKGKFRADLLYRIRIARVLLPPLRDRHEDIPLLVEAFLTKSREETGKSVSIVSNDAMNALLEYHWPGNVRELKSAIDYATLHCQGAIIQLDDLPPELLIPSSQSKQMPGKLDEKQLIINALEASKGNRNEAAKLLGISRATLFRRLSEYGLTRSASDSSTNRS